MVSVLWYNYPWKQTLKTYIFPVNRNSGMEPSDECFFWPRQKSTLLLVYFCYSNWLQRLFGYSEFYVTYIRYSCEIVITVSICHLEPNNWILGWTTSYQETGFTLIFFWKSICLFCLHLCNFMAMKFKSWNSQLFRKLLLFLWMQFFLLLFKENFQCPLNFRERHLRLPILSFKLYCEAFGKAFSVKEPTYRSDLQ